MQPSSSCPRSLGRLAKSDLLEAWWPAGLLAAAEPLSCAWKLPRLREVDPFQLRQPGACTLCSAQPRDRCARPRFCHRSCAAPRSGRHTGRLRALIVHIATPPCPLYGRFVWARSRPLNSPHSPKTAVPSPGSVRPPLRAAPPRHCCCRARLDKSRLAFRPAISAPYRVSIYKRELARVIDRTALV